MPLQIAIIGAGPAGCMLARLLLPHHPNKISISVFEADVSPDSRGQGGTLDLHADSGLLAMEEAGLYDEFLKYARFDGEAFMMCDKELRAYLELPGTSSDKSTRGRPEIDRSALRKILVESLPEGMIQWNCRLRRVDEDRKLIFDDGREEAGFDLIVGADGAWSKVRSLLSEQKPIYTGVGGYGLSIPNARENAPDAYRLVNRGSIFAFSDGNSIMGQQMGDGSIHVASWGVRCEHRHTQMNQGGNGGPTSPVTKETICGEFQGWALELLDLVRLADDEPVPRSIYMLPIGFKWPRKSGVTLLGDAAHLMPPFSGEGVNLALQDSRELARAIVHACKAGEAGSGKALASELVKYETGMYLRTAKAARVACDMMKYMLFEPGAPRTVIERLVIEMLCGQMHPVLYWMVYPFTALAVYSFYFVYKRLR